MVFPAPMLIHITLLNTSSRMPTSQQRQSNDDRHKLQRPKIHLMRLQLALKPLRRLSQPKSNTQIDEQHRDPKRRIERLTSSLECNASCTPDKQSQQHDEHQERKSLKHQTREQDVIRIRRVPAIRVRDANQCRADDLDHGRDDVAGDEDPEDEFWAQGRVPRAVGRGAYEHREDGVDCGCEEDRGYDDEEVLDHEVGDFVGVAFCAEGARDVADDFLGVSAYRCFFCHSVRFR